MGRRAAAVVALGAGGVLAYLLTRPADLGDDLEGVPRLDNIDPPGGLFNGSVESYLRSRGLTSDLARGIAAGIYAESLGDPTAINPTSGAYGLGQWLGARKAALFARYGTNPSAQDQLDFLLWELRGGDYAGPRVLSQQGAGNVLDAYIRQFMRPRAGRETEGDLARGGGYLRNMG